MSSRQRVVMFSLGGTIASTRSDTSSNLVAPQMNAADIVASVPGLSEVAQVESVSFRRLPSGDLTVSDIVELADEILRSLGAGVDGVVVTQGTDTIEETAFILDLLIRADQPVVVSGAMRNPTAVGADGPANLLAATRVATSSVAAGLGTMVVLNDEIHAARFVRKTNSTNLGAFQSPSAGPLGWIVEDRVRIVSRVPPLRAFGTVDASRIGAVALVRLALGDDDRMIRQISAARFGGAVVEGFGGGHVPARLVSAIEELASVIPVVLASRTGSGELLKGTYGFPGSEQDVLSRGVMSSGPLDGLKAKVLLSLLLSRSSDFGILKRDFEDVVDSIAPADHS